MTNAQLNLLTFVTLLREGLKVSPALASAALFRAQREQIESHNLTEWYSSSVGEPHLFSDQMLGEAQKRIVKTLEIGIACISIVDPEYPKALKKVEGAPPVLYVRGRLDILHHIPGVAVVGTRKATTTGLKIAERIASHFSMLGWPVVSGLALGIDAAAHRGALTGKGSTIAVLAHGLQAAFPRTNADLGKQIIEQGGAWISEYPAGTTARPEQFIARNRIQIGLSAGSVIVEGEEKSGSMAQAEFCLRNNRELFAVMESREKPWGLLNAGTKLLVQKRGAFGIHSREDYDEVERRLIAKKHQLEAN